MRKLLFLLPLLYLLGCSLQHTMERSNDLMVQNAEIMEASKAAIEENTREIQKATDMMSGLSFLLPFLLGMAACCLGFVAYRFTLRMWRKKHNPLYGVERDDDRKGEDNHKR